MPCVICGRRIRAELKHRPWCGDNVCAEQILGWRFKTEDDFDADELGLDPEEEFDA